MVHVVDPARSDATRYLCAGAQLNDAFCRRVIEEVVDARHRAIAPSYGLDIVPVARHCLTAHRRRLTRDGLVLGLVVLALVVSFPVAAGVLLLLFATWLVWRIVTWSRALARAVNVADTPQGQLIRVVVLLVLVVLVVAVVAVSALSLTAGGLLYELVVRGAMVDIRPGEAYTALVLIVLSWAVVVCERFARGQALELLRRARFDPNRRGALSARVEDRLEVIARLQRSNVTFYSGYSPFVGAGNPTRNWEFALELDPPKAPADQNGMPSAGFVVRQPQSFEIGELRDHVRRRLEELAGDHVKPTERLEGLDIQDRAFAHGLLSGTSGVFLPDPMGPPTPMLDEPIMNAIINDPNGEIRHYQCVRVGSWQEELVVSVFLHYALDGRMLYFEFDAFVLYPIRDQYHAVDRLPNPSRGSTVLVERPSKPTATVPSRPARSVAAYTPLPTRTDSTTTMK